MESGDGVAGHNYESGGGDDAVGGERLEHEWVLGAKLRRGIAAGKRGGVCTPVPSWKLGAGISGGGGDNPIRTGGGAATVSARRLGANLWEIQDLPPIPEMSRRGGKVRQHKEVKGSELVDLASKSPHERPRSTGSQRRHPMPLIQHHKRAHRNVQGPQTASPGGYNSSMEIAAYNKALAAGSSLDLTEKLRDSGYNLKTSTELLNVLNRIWSLEEQSASNASRVRALELELANARAHVQELLEEQQADRHEIDSLLKQVAEDKLKRKSRERERLRAAIQSVKDELEDERRLRRHSESLHRSLAKELCEVRSLYSKALKDLERERKENALLEDLCDELAKGIGDYDQEVRQLKQKHEDFSPICDRLVLHISEAWLDERMQLKLAESRGDFGERDSIVDRLGCEVESFVQAKQSSHPGSDICTMVQGEEREDNYLRRQSLESLYLNGAVSAPQDAEDEDSITSDSHCFELNTRAGGMGVCMSDGGKLEEPRISSSIRKKLEQLERTKGHGSPITRTELDSQQDLLSPRINRKGSTKFRPGEDDRRKSKLKLDERHHLDNGNGTCTKGQLDLKIHPDDGGGSEDNTSANVIRLKGKSIAVSSCDLSVDRPCGCVTSSVPPQNLQQAFSEAEIITSTSESRKGVRESTLKAKLLEARLEGQQARLRMPKGLRFG